MADNIERLRLVKGGHHVDSRSRTHPGANARSMHAGVVMRRMLEFVRDRAAGRHSQ
ncbi:MAG: hypothetical protein K0S45_1283 [Nitrospira sp.]|jgi:hypothetical protein|nr:hypothetical protein [Nitrospira sp.]